MQAFAYMHLAVSVVSPRVKNRREEEDLVLMWESDHRVNDNYTVEVQELWWMEKFLRPVHVDWNHLKLSEGGISSFCFPGLLPPQPAM